MILFITVLTSLQKTQVAEAGEQPGRKKLSQPLSTYLLILPVVPFKRSQSTAVIELIFNQFSESSAASC